MSRDTPPHLILIEGAPSPKTTLPHRRPGPKFPPGAGGRPAGWQKLAVIADNYQLLILTRAEGARRARAVRAPKAPAGLGQCAYLA